MAEARQVSRGGCGVKAWVEENLDAADREELAAVLESSVRTAAIFRALTKRGFAMRYDALRKHRAGECPCGRAA
jgi:hypothetical protein